MPHQQYFSYWWRKLGYSEKSTDLLQVSLEIDLI